MIMVIVIMTGTTYIVLPQVSEGWPPHLKDGPPSLRMATRLGVHPPYPGVQGRGMTNTTLQPPTLEASWL